jgi:adenylate cyclase
MWRLLRAHRSRLGIPLVVGLLVCAVILGVRELGWLVSWELGAFDNYLRLRPTVVSEPPVTMVWVREEEIAEFGHPLPDDVLAQALRRILSLGPRAVGLDIYRDRPHGEGWSELRDVFLENPALVIVEKLPDAQHPAVLPPDFLGDRRQVGFSDIAPDDDGVTRRGLLMLWDEEGRAYLSLALQLALRYLQPEGLTLAPAPEDPAFVRLGAATLPPVEPDLGGYKRVDAGGYQLLLDYRRPNGAYPGVSLSEVLAGRAPAERFRDRVVVVGTASPSVKDYFQTPSAFLSRHGASVYGAEHHAHVVDQLARHARGRDAPIASPAEAWERVWIVGWCLLGALVGTRVRSPLSLTAAVVGGLGVLMVCTFAAFLRAWWIPLVPAAIGGLGALALGVAWVTQQERADKAKVMNLFGRFVSRKVVDRIWEDREIFMEGGRPRPQRIGVTVMLTDLIGYTAASEKREPAEVMDWIGGYMDRMAALVETHGGVVADFLGDGLMAAFGVPVARNNEQQIDEDARSAVACGLAMGEALTQLNEAWRRGGQPTARMRVGILTGPAVVGSLGSAERMKYATVGNTVNTASRLESFDKMSFELEPEHSVCRVLVGESTYERLGGRFVTRCLGAHRLKGRGDPVTIYRVLGRAEDAEAPAVVGVERSA